MNRGRETEYEDVGQSRQRHDRPCPLKSSSLIHNPSWAAFRTRWPRMLGASRVE